MDLILLSLACVAFAMSRTGSRYQYLQTNTFRSKAESVPRNALIAAVNSRPSISRSTFVECAIQSCSSSSTSSSPALLSRPRAHAVDRCVARDSAEIRRKMLRLLWRNRVPRFQPCVVDTLLGILLVPKDGTRDVHTVRIVFAARLGDCLLRPVVI